MPHRTSVALAGEPRPHHNFVAFRTLAASMGCLARDHGDGFWTVTSRSIAVSYWPDTGEAYVHNVASPWHTTTSEGAIELALSPPRRVLAPSPWGRQKAREKLGLGDLRERVLARALQPISGASCCYWCGESFDPRDMTLDHVVPRHLGGVNRLENLVAACHWCNEERGSSMPELDPNWRPKGPPSPEAAWQGRFDRVRSVMLCVPSPKRIRRLRREPNPCLRRILAMVEGTQLESEREAR